MQSFDSFRYAKTFSWNQPDPEIAPYPACAILAHIEVLLLICA